MPRTLHCTPACLTACLTPLSPSVIPSLAHSTLKTFLRSPSTNPSHHSLFFFFRTDSTDSPDRLPILLGVFVFKKFFPLFISYFSVPCGRVSCRLSDTADIVYDRVYVTVSRPSVCPLSVPAVDSCSRFCCCGPGRQETSIDCRQVATAPQQHDGQQQIDRQVTDR